MYIWSIDWEGNVGGTRSANFCIDQNPLDIGEIEWETFQDSSIFGVWYCKFTCKADDGGGSGIDRVEMYINDELFETTSSAPYEFTIKWFNAYKRDMFKFIFYDNVGNSAFEIINGSDIKSHSYSQSSSSQQSSNLLFFQILQRLLKLQ